MQEWLTARCPFISWQLGACTEAPEAAALLPLPHRGAFPSSHCSSTSNNFRQRNTSEQRDFTVQTSAPLLSAGVEANLLPYPATGDTRVHEIFSSCIWMQSCSINTSVLDQR